MGLHAGAEIETRGAVGEQGPRAAVREDGGKRAPNIVASSLSREAPRLNLARPILLSNVRESRL
jgi:hypothetical protein